MLSNIIKQRFVKDYSLPIQLLQEPYFEYLINLYDNHLNTESKYNLLNETINNIGGEEKFLSEYHKIKDNILNTMKTNKIFNKFNNEDLSRYNIPDHSYSKNDVFNCENDGKYFVSIDLTKANFQAMKYYDKDLILGYDDYNSFINNFTNLEYIKESKYIRQVIFGNMNPKRQIKIQKYLMYKVIDLIDNNFEFLNKQNIKMFSADEIVYQIKDAIQFNTKNIVKNTKENLGLDVHVEVYWLKHLKPMKYFVKEFCNKTGYELMCVPKIFYSQVYKYYNNIELNDWDLTYFHENQLARFLYPVYKNERVDYF